MSDLIERITQKLDELLKVKDPLEFRLTSIRISQEMEIPVEEVEKLLEIYKLKYQYVKLNPIQKILFNLERGLEKVSDSLSKMDIFIILEYISKLSSLSLIFGVAGFFVGLNLQKDEVKLREKEAVSQAWQTIISAHGKPGSLGRREALEFLNNLDEELYVKERLVGLDLSDSSLVGINLSGGFLQNIKFRNSDLAQANFSNKNGNNTVLYNADFTKTNLWQSDLSNSDLRRVKFIQTESLDGAKFENAKLDQAILVKIDLSKALGLQVEQLKEAYLCNIKLPDDLLSSDSIDTNKNCEELATILVNAAYFQNRKDANRYIQDESLVPQTK